MKIKLSVLSLFIGLSSVLLAQEKLISLRPTLNSDDTKSCPFSQRDTRVREYVACKDGMATAYRTYDRNRFFVPSG